LEADEWHVMQGHALHTLRILERVGVLSDMATIAAAHHERLDGKGYPHNLDAATISLDTRIITVCDFFDALTADRPYRAAMSVEKALEIMAGEVNVALDPRCFEALRTVTANGLPNVR
ncbi:MAG: HD domain-containing phosphohydrolase, partial [Pseudomonadota bacterium]